jgi:hypothetical protein
MNENTGGNVGDITSEIEMVENQEICLTRPIRPEHQDEHHESRESPIAFQKEKIFKRKSKLDQDLEASNSRRSLQTEMCCWLRQLMH